MTTIYILLAFSNGVFRGSIHCDTTCTAVTLANFDKQFELIAPEKCGDFKWRRLWRIRDGYVYDVTCVDKDGSPKLSVTRVEGIDTREKSE